MDHSKICEMIKYYGSFEKFDAVESIFAGQYMDVVLAMFETFELDEGVNYLFSERYHLENEYLKIQGMFNRDFQPRKNLRMAYIAMKLLCEDIQKLM